MKQNNNSFSGIVKRLFVGSLLVGVGEILSAFMIGGKHHSNIPKEDELSQQQHQLPSTMKVDKIIETDKHVKPIIGWIVLFFFVSAITIIAGVRTKKNINEFL
jgi:hypothetical protein